VGRRHCRLVHVELGQQELSCSVQGRTKCARQTLTVGEPKVYDDDDDDHDNVDM